MINMIPEVNFTNNSRIRILSCSLRNMTNHIPNLTIDFEFNDLD